MFRLILALALAAGALSGCTVDALFPQAVTLAPRPLWLPTSAQIWPAQQAPDPETDAAMAETDSPQAVAGWLESHTTWRDDYDTTTFLAPGRFRAEGRGVCSAFARWWLEALTRQGIDAEFVAMWAPDGAHAVVVYASPAGWRLCSNAYLYERPLVSAGEVNRGAARVAAAEEFFPGTWRELRAYAPDGSARARLVSATAPHPAGLAEDPLPPAPWKIRR